MRKALLAALPDEAPGLTVPDAKEALLPLLPDESVLVHWPDGLQKDRSLAGFSLAQ